MTQGPFRRDEDRAGQSHTYGCQSTRSGRKKEVEAAFEPRTRHQPSMTRRSTICAISGSVETNTTDQASSFEHEAAEKVSRKARLDIVQAAVKDQQLRRITIIRARSTRRIWLRVKLAPFP